MSLPSAPLSGEIAFWRIYRANAKRIVAVMLATLVVSLLVNIFLLPRKYEAQVAFWARKSALNPSVRETLVETYRSVILSNALIDRVMTEFKLRDEPYEMKLRDFRKALKFKTKRQSEAIEVTFLLDDPQKSAAVLKRLAELAVTQANEIFASQQVSSRQTAQAEYESAKKELSDFTQEWMAFRKTSQLRQREDEIHWRAQAASEIYKGPNVFGDANPADISGLAQLDGLIAAREAAIASMKNALAQSPSRLLLREFRGDISADNAGKTRPADGGKESLNPIHEQLGPELARAEADLEALKARKVKVEAAFKDNEKRLTELEALWEPDQARDQSYVRQLESLGYAFQAVIQKYQEAKVRTLENAETMVVVDPVVTPDQFSRPRIALNVALSLVIAFTLLSMALFGQDYYRQVTRGKAS